MPANRFWSNIETIVEIQCCKYISGMCQKSWLDIIKSFNNTHLLIVQIPFITTVQTQKTLLHVTKISKALLNVEVCGLNSGTTNNVNVCFYLDV